MWDQQSYNQTHEPVWASKEVKQPSSKCHLLAELQQVLYLLLYPTEQRYNYGKSSTSSSSAQGTSRGGGGGGTGSGGAATKGPVKNPNRPVPPPPPTGVGQSKGPPMERQYTGQFSMFVDEGQFPTWED